MTEMYTVKYMACDGLISKHQEYLKNDYDSYYYNKLIDKYMHFPMAISMAVTIISFLFLK